jgi:hypothetical protein
LYIAKSKGGVDEGGDNNTSGDDEAVRGLAAEVATTSGGSDNINVAADSTMGKGKQPSRRTNRPTGLRYKLRAPIRRNKIKKKHIQGQCAQLWGFLVKLCTNEWQATYGGEVTSSAAADDGSAEAPTPNATIAGKVDLVGQEGSSRDVHTPRFGERFKQQAMQIFSDFEVTVRGHQRLVNLLSNY